MKPNLLYWMWQPGHTRAQFPSRANELGITCGLWCQLGTTLNCWTLEILTTLSQSERTIAYCHIGCPVIALVAGTYWSPDDTTLISAVVCWVFTHELFEKEVLRLKDTTEDWVEDGLDYYVQTSGPDAFRILERCQWRTKRTRCQLMSPDGYLEWRKIKEQRQQVTVG